MKLENAKPTDKRPLTITFTVEEQDVLFAVMRLIGGHPDHSDRKHTDELHDILLDNGHSVHNNKFYDHNKDKYGIEGAITFKETNQ